MNWKISAFNEQDQPYTEVFKEWLESNGHTSFSKFINWEHEENEIELKRYEIFRKGELLKDTYHFYDWDLHWSREEMKQVSFDKTEKDLELGILLYQWLGDIRKKQNPKARSDYEKIKALQKELTNHRYWKQKQKQAKQALPVVITIIGLITVVYLLWPKKSELSQEEVNNQDTIQNNDDWARPNRPLWLY